MFTGKHTIAINNLFHTTSVLFSKNNIAFLSGLCNELEISDEINRKDNLVFKEKEV